MTLDINANLQEKIANDRDVERRLREFATNIPFFDFIGVQLEIRGNELTLVMPFQQHLVGNPTLPAIHGGVIGAFLEITATLQLAFKSRLTGIPKTISLTVDYHRSARPVDTYARANIVKLGRRVSSVHVEAWQDDQSRPTAAAHGNFIMPQPKTD